MSMLSSTMKVRRVRVGHSASGSGCRKAIGIDAEGCGEARVSSIEASAGSIEVQRSTSLLRSATWLPLRLLPIAGRDDLCSMMFLRLIVMAMNLG
ncbi:MAG: hypothetical protein JSR49_10765 [Proteobacteria bacterium]|nr:hypothetical protein [Pseudomonadota bacterium]